jgi:hypothetical protein
MSRLRCVALPFRTIKLPSSNSYSSCYSFDNLFNCDSGRRSAIFCTVVNVIGYHTEGFEYTISCLPCCFTASMNSAEWVINQWLFMSDFQSPFRVLDTMTLPQNMQKGFWKNKSCFVLRTLKLLKWFRSLSARSGLEAK